jgi:hypothetical protein
MSEAIVIHTHKKKVQIPKKVAVNADGTLKVVKQRTKKAVELDADGNPIVLAEPVQRFQITHGEKTCIIKMGNVSFGIKSDSGIENIMRNCDKDIDDIRKILSFMRTLRTAKVSFEDIANRIILATASLPQTIKVLSNNLNKPITKKPVAVVVVDTE